jgi:hypothetical protein
MEKNILLEIHRMNELMGVKHKPLIMEQGLFGAAVRMFIKKGLTFEQALDDAAELLVASGKMGQKEVDDAVRLLKNEKSLVDDINKTYKNSKLAATLNDDLRITAKIDDLIKKSGSKSLDDFIKSVRLLTQKEVDFITSSVVKNMIKNNEFVNAAETFINVWNPELKKILRETLANSKSKLNLSDFANAYETASKIWAEGFVSRYKTALKNQLDLGKISKSDYDKLILNADKEVGEPVMQFLKDKHKYTNDSEIMSIVDEYRVAGRLDEGAGTISKPIYGKNNVGDTISEFSDDGSGKSFFRGSDDNLPVNVDNNLPDVIVDDIPIIDWGDLSIGVRTTVEEVEKKYPGIISKIGHIQLDTIYNLLRSFLGIRGSATYLNDAQKVVNTLVEDFLPQFRSAAGKISEGNIDSFANTCRQLLVDMKLSKTSGQSWDQLWEAIKTDIRTKAVANGSSTEAADAFIKSIEKGGGMSGDVLKRPERTIEFFLQTMSEFANRPTWFVKGTRKAYANTDTFSEWIGLKRYYDEFKGTIKKIDETWTQKGIWPKLQTVLYEIPKAIWSWFSGFLLYRAPRTYQRIVKEINFGGVTSGNSFITLGKTYVAMVILKNLVGPIWEATTQWIETLLSKTGIDFTEGNDEESAKDLIKRQYSENLENLISGNPEAFNPFGGVGPVLTLVKSSIAAWWENPEDEKKKAQDDYNKQLNEAIVKNLKIKSEKNKQVWDSSDEKKRELIKTKNGFKEIERILRNYTDPRLKVHNPNFVPLNYDQYNKIKESLEFIPELDPSIVEKITQSTTDEKKKGLKRDVDLYHQVNDVMGYTAIKAKDGKHYKVVQRDLWLHYITPSVEEIMLTPDVKQTQNDLNTILDKL